MDSSDLSRRTISLFSYLSAAGFLVLFPGFFFYQTLLGLGVIPALLGGFYRPMALVLVVLLVLYAAFVKQPLFGPLNKASILFVCILSWIGVVAVSNYLLGDQAGNKELLEYNMSAILLNTVGFLLMVRLPLGAKLFEALVYLCLAVMIILVLMLATDGVFYLRIQGLGEEEKTSTYQGFARSLAVTGIVAVAVARSGFLRLLISVCTIIALYLNVARSEFVCFPLALLFLWGAYTMWSKRRLLPLAAFTLCALLLPFVPLDKVQERLPENRILQLLDIAGASSARDRARFAEAGWEEVSKRPLLGNYGFYYDTEGLGGYPHSILAAWVNLGLLGIGMYISLFMVICAIQIQLIKAGLLGHPVLDAALMSLAFCLVAVLFAKEYSYILVGITVGLTQQALNVACSGSHMASSDHLAAS
jgi:hypothetical protein